MVLPGCESVQPGKAARSREGDEDDLGVGSHAHRWSPRACSTRGQYLELAKTLQPIGEFAVDPPRDERKGKNLPAVCVAGKLKAYTGPLDDGKTMRHVTEKDTRLSVREVQAVEIGMQMGRIGGVGIGDADDLEAVDVDALIL